VARFISTSIFTAVDIWGYRTKTFTYTGYVNDEKCVCRWNLSLSQKK